MSLDKNQMLLAEAEETTADMLKLFKDESWMLVKTSCKDGIEIRVSRKASDEFQGNAYRAECDLNTDLDSVIPYLLPAPRGKRPQWDTTVRACDVINEIDNETFVSHLTAHSSLMGLISPREFYHLNAIRRLEDNMITCVCTKSIDSQEFPAARRGVVRATSYPSGFFLVRLPEGDNVRTRVINISQVSVGGSIPQSLVESSTPEHVTKIMRDLCTAVHKQ